MNIYQRIALILGVVIVFTLIKWDVFVFADENKMSPVALRDLPGVYLAIDERIEEGSLTKEQIQTDIELKLRMAGIKVLSHEEFLKAAGRPFLYINTHIIKHETGKFYIFYTQVELYQGVYLVRKPKVETIGVVTWSTRHVLGLTYNLDDIRARVKDQVDSFINAYLSVNPK